MTADGVTRPPALTPPPAALVVGGRHQLGSFDAPVPEVNLADAVVAGGPRGRLARAARDLRTKEWQAFQLGNDEWFVLGAVYDAKVVGIVMVIAVHKESGRMLRWIDKVPSWRVQVARGLYSSTSSGRSRGGSLAVTNGLADGRIDIEGRHVGGGRRSSMQLSGTGHFGDEARHLAVCHPFEGKRILYTDKCIVPFSGELRIDDQVVTFAPDRSFMIIDDHHGEYPSPQVYDWVTGARNDGEAIVGFNLTHNQVLDPATYNENALWSDGTLHRLPPVTFDRPQGVGGPWHVTDAAGTVDVTFTPEVCSTLHVGPRRSLAEYHAPYGRFRGRIDVDGVTTQLDGFFGMGEKKNIRV